MYSPRIIDRSIERIEKMEGVKLKRYKIDSSVNMADDINNLYDESTKSYRRPLTKEEQDFIRNEQLMCSVDFMYWARRYMKIKTKSPGPPRLYDPWESQLLLHELMSDLEDTAVERQDGILITTLKARQLGMCLSVDSTVLNDSLDWVNIDKIKVGDRLVSIDEGETLEENKRTIADNAMARKFRNKFGIKKEGKKRNKPERKMRIATVLAKREIFDNAVKLTMENGLVLKATKEHRFLSRKNKYGRWNTVDSLKVGDEIRFLCNPWDDTNTFDDGWFSGIIDGEGSLRNKERSGSELCVAQVDGPVLNKARKYLIDNGYKFREDIDNRKGGEKSKFGSKPVYKLVLSRMADIFRLIGKTKPVRFDNSWWIGKSLPGKKIGNSWSKIVSIEHLPAQRMIDLQTSTKTFIANGFVSHNSTVYEGALSHRAFSTCGFTGMLAADEPEQSMYLFSMMERIYDNLPQFLKPAITYHVKNEHMSFGKLDSIIFVSHGNLKADMGRGKTPHAVHLSELEKWPNTDQIDSGLLVSLPRLPTTVAFFESTGEIRGSWWHGFCEDSIEKQNRFTMFFVPWYAEPNTYIKPAPEDWTPDKVTTNHAELVERESPQWMRGKTVRLNRDQLYFWEFTRNEYARKGKTGVFFCEYASSPREAFRSANSSIFTYEIIEFLRSKSSFPKGYEVIGPGIDHDRISLAQVDHIKRKARRVDIKPQHDFETN